GGDWLEDEVAAWGREGIKVVLSLLTEEEVAELKLEDEAGLCQRQGIEFLSFPIADRDVPESPKAVRELIERLVELLREGKNIAVHCRQGVGRASLIAASLLVTRGEGVDKVFQALTQIRKCAVPETPEQRQWVEEFARSHSAAVRHS